MKKIKDLLIDSIKTKITVLSLVAITGIILVGIYSYINYQNIKNNFSSLAQNNPKLELVNQINYDLNRINQNIRLEAIKGTRKPSNQFYEINDIIINQIDSLNSYLGTNNPLTQKLDSLILLTQLRNKFYESYLEQRYQYFKSRQKLELKAEDIKNELAQKIDSNKKVIIIEKTIRPEIDQNKIEPSEKNKEEKKGNWLSRLFGSKKENQKVETQNNESKEPIWVEEIETLIDTSNFESFNTLGDNIKESIIDINENRLNQSQKLINKELELLNFNIQINEGFNRVLEEISKNEKKIQNKTVTETLENGKKSILINQIIGLFGIGIILILIVLLIKDLNRNSLLKAELTMAKLAAEKSEKEKQKLVQNISHDLKTPLQSIIGFSEIKLNKNPEDKELKIIQNSASHLNDVLDEILDYSKLEAGKIILKKSLEKPIEIVNDIINILKIQLNSKDLELELIVNDLNLKKYYEVDVKRLKQILFNLIGNAIKFTPRNGKIKIEIKSIYNGLYFSIEDNGIGISENEQKRIFKEFSQANDNIEGDYGGSGLGLIICKELVQMMGGELQLKSEKQKGSKFSFNIKSISKENKEDQTNPEKNIFKKVWVIEDDAYIRRWYQEIFRQSDIDYQLFENEKEFNEEIEKEIPELLILDLRLPGKNGIDIAKDLKNKFPKIKITAISADKKLIKENIEYFDFHIIKPFTQKEIENLLGIKDPSQNNFPVEIYISESQKDLNNLEIKLENNEDISYEIHRLSGRNFQAGFKEFGYEWRNYEINNYDLNHKNSINELINKQKELINKLNKN